MCSLNGPNKRKKSQLSFDMESKNASVCNSLSPKQTTQCVKRAMHFLAVCFAAIVLIWPAGVRAWISIPNIQLPTFQIPTFQLPTIQLPNFPSPTVPPSSGIPFTCGDPTLNRIVGGQDATPHSIPWQAGLVISKNTYDVYCGGVIVSPYHVLTAAHCLWGDSPQTSGQGRQVLVGEHDRSDGMHNLVRHDIQCASKHPLYYQPPYDSMLDHDFAIITLKVCNQIILN